MKIIITILFISLSIMTYQATLLYAQTTKCHPQDSLALIDLYNNMDGPNWTYPNFGASNKWLQGRVATWYGVGVAKYGSESQPYRVFLLDLMDNNLKGNLPPSIGDLIYLEKLLLSQNQIMGAIPKEITKLSNLNRLALIENQVTSIPDSIGLLTNLKELWLRNNKINDTIPNTIGGLINLEYFDCSQNQLSGPIPDEIGNLSNLKFIDLYLNHISGALPSSIVNLKNLSQLRIPYNLISEIPNLTPLSQSSGGSLQVLWINNNRLSFSDIIPNMDIASNFVYAPQDSIGYELTVLAELGDTKILEWSFNEEGNVYQWMKDGAEIAGAESKELTVNIQTLPDFGEYSLKITNPAASDLILITRPIILPPPYYQFCSITPAKVFPNNLSKIMASEFYLFVSALEGDVDLYMGGVYDDLPIELQVGQTLVPGDHIFTGIESAVRLTWADCSSCVLQELDDIKIETLRRTGNAVNAQLLIKAGEVDAAVPEQAAVRSDFKIRTPTATCSVRGTNFSVKHDSSSEISTIMVSKGSVSVMPEYSPADSITLEPWQKVTVSSSSISEVSTFTLNSIEIMPKTITVKTGREHLFSAIGYDQDGNSTSIQPFWESEGGTIDNTGLFTSDSTEGIFTITAIEPTHNLTATTTVIVEKFPVGIKQVFGMPNDFKLSQNYPNPFNPTTFIKYSIPEKNKVILKIYDVLGRLIVKLVDEEQLQGNYEVRFNADDLSSGIYFFRITAGKFIDTKKMIFMK